MATGQKTTTSALECPVYFLGENRSNAYLRYVLRGSELKNVLGTKNDFQGRTCFGLERRGA